MLVKPFLLNGWIVNFIWGIADDVLRDVYVRSKYRDVILPMTVIRRLDSVLEDTKQEVLDMKKRLDEAGVTNQEAALRKAASHSSIPLHSLSGISEPGQRRVSSRLILKHIWMDSPLRFKRYLTSLSSGTRYLFYTMLMPLDLLSKNFSILM